MNHYIRTSLIPILVLCIAGQCNSQSSDIKDAAPTEGHGKQTELIKNSNGWGLIGFDSAATSYNPYEKRINADNVGRLKSLWSNRHRSTIRSYVSVIGNTAYYGTYGGEFLAVETTTGNTIWKKQLHGKHQGHAVVGKVAYVSSIRRLYAFVAASGEELWSKPCTSGNFSGPLVSDGVLYVGTSSPAQMRALATSDGQSLWAIAGKGSTAVSKGVLYRTLDTFLEAIDAETGKLLWKTADIEGRLTRPAISHDVVYIHSTTGKLYAFDAQDRTTQLRTPLWIGSTSLQKSGDAATSPAVAHGKVFVGANSKFYAFKTDDEVVATKDEVPIRMPVWTADVEAPFFADSPSVANGVVFSTAGYYDIYALDAANGKVLWNFHSRGSKYPMRSKPTIADGRLFHAATFGFTLYVFDLPEDAETRGQ